eukprot:COSAG06_NODE_1788_length_8396_cov_7.074485_2_plen_658_part_00
MQVFVTAQDGRQITVEVEGHMTVAALKDLIKQQEGLDVVKMVAPVTLHSKVNMVDNRTLESYGVKKEAELQLVARGTAQQAGAGDADGVAARRTAEALRSIRQMCDGVGERRQELDNARFELTARRAAIAERNGGAGKKKKLKLNVGGVSITVLRSTLMSRPRTRLAALASGIYDGQLHRDRKKRIFLDLNPECFREIIDWLSACELVQPGSEMPRVATPPGHADTMEHMLRFLGLDERPAPAEEGEPPVPADDAAAPEPEPQGPADGEAWEQYPVEAAAGELLGALQAERVSLRAAIDAHQEMVAEFEEEQEWIKYFSKAPAAAPDQAPELVDLDVSGTPVTVKRSTLTLCAESALAQRFSAERWAQEQQGGEDSEDSDDDDEDEQGIFIKESSYSFCKIVDQLRLRAMAPEGALPPPPTIAADKQQAFSAVLSHYFAGAEHFIVTLPKPDLQGYADPAPTYHKDSPIEPNAPQGELAIGEGNLRFAAVGLPAGLAVDAETGVLSGTPTEVAEEPVAVEVTATNVAGRSVAQLQIVVHSSAVTFVGWAQWKQNLPQDSFAQSDAKMDAAAAAAHPGCRAATGEEYAQGRIRNMPATNTSGGFLIFKSPGNEGNENASCRDGRCHQGKNSNSSLLEDREIWTRTAYCGERKTMCVRP